MVVEIPQRRRASLHTFHDHLYGGKARALASREAKRLAKEWRECMVQYGGR
jgi:hypothetical protein